MFEAEGWFCGAVAGDFFIGVFSFVVVAPALLFFEVV